MPITSSFIFRSKRFFSLMIAVIFITGSVLTYYVYSFVHQSDLRSLARGAQTIASSIDAEEVTALYGSEEDLENPAYQSLKAKLQRIQSVEENVEFVYIVGKNSEGKFFFYGDSEDPDSEDYSPPGQIYDEADQSFDDAFNTGEPNVTGPTSDRWGTWITALAPIKDPETNAVIAAVGMDIDASAHQNYVYTNTAIPAFITLILLILAFVGQHISKKEQQILELKSEFVSIASHELRSPLNGITWALDNISSAPNLTPPQVDTIAEMKVTANNLMSNINDILNASSITGGKGSRLLIEQVDLVGLLKSITDQQLLTAKKNNVNISLHNIPAGSHIIRGDREKLKRVFNNLLSNSIKYSKPNSDVEVSIEQTADYYLIHFTDHGIGITQEDQEKIFDGYYRATNAVQSGVGGTGLGLFFAKRIVEMHGGKIWLKSEENKGTTVFVQIPINKKK